MALTETNYQEWDHTELDDGFAPVPPPPVRVLPKAVPTLDELGELTRPVAWAQDRILPVDVSVKGLFPDGGLRRGSTVVVSGSTSLALATMAAASAQGSWCAAVGMPSLGLVAAAEMGVELERFALVPRPGDQWSVVASALLDAFDVVLLSPMGAVRQSDARRLSAKARERGAVLVPVTDAWPTADLKLRCTSMSWSGLGNGHGHLKRRQLSVESDGKGVASRGRSLSVSLAS